MITADTLVLPGQHNTNIRCMSRLPQSRPLPRSPPDRKLADATLPFKLIGTRLRARYTCHPYIISDPYIPAAIGSLSAATTCTTKRVLKKHPPHQTKKVAKSVVSKN
jgi:hypothetical protein